MRYTRKSVIPADIHPYLELFRPYAEHPYIRFPYDWSNIHWYKIQKGRVIISYYNGDWIVEFI